MEKFKNIMKKISGVITLLAAVVFGVFIIVKHFEELSHYKIRPETTLGRCALILLAAIIIFYVISTLKETRRSQSAELNREINQLKKQVEIQKLKKELDELEKFNNTN